MSRPFRRIVVSAGAGARVPESARRVDISLRHFDLRDIHELMAVIKARRPDLSLPKGFG